jgi:flavin-dependent dehydrogenase
MGHPERWFSPIGSYSGPNVLLVGDAAGIEPLFGEGISMALAYGPIAAGAVKNAFEQKNFEFRNYTDAILRSHLGKILQRNRIVAKLFYKRQLQKLWVLLGKAAEVYFNYNARNAGRMNDAC